MTLSAGLKHFALTEGWREKERERESPAVSLLLQKEDRH